MPRYKFSVVLIIAFIVSNPACVLSGPAPAQSPSFNCRKATSAVEHAICDNSQLASLDAELGGLFKSAPFDMREDEKAWLSWRDFCPSKPAGDDSMELMDCVRGFYERRITELKYVNGLNGVGEADASTAAQLLTQAIRCPIPVHGDRLEQVVNRISFTGDSRAFSIREESTSVWVGHSAVGRIDDPTSKQELADDVSARFSELLFAVPNAGNWLLVVCKQERRCITHSAGEAEWYYVLVLCDQASQRDAADALNTLVMFSRQR